MDLVCASANPDKVAEIAAILATGTGISLHPRPPGLGEVVEDADSLEGNARLKAAAVCAATGRPAVADDTGLEVPALGGAPGVYSARYAGEGASYADNREKLLRELAAAGGEQRRARFVTVVVVRWPEGGEVVCRGECEGWITESERGTRGFGYDSVFAPGDGSRTFAEMSDTEKNDISHRGIAFRKLVAELSRRPESPD